MGNGPYSLISQLGHRVNYQFSYCLTDNDNLASPTFLSFGDYIIRPPFMYTTPIHIFPNRYSYFLTLHDISVGGQRLNLPSHYFATNSDGSGGTAIDSGTVLSYIVTGAFDVILNAITNYISNNNIFLQKYEGDPVAGLEACWEPLTDSPAIFLPTLTFHFDNNADLLVQSSDLFWIYPMPGVDEPGAYCLTLCRSQPHEGNIIGASIQINQRFIYDVGNLQLSFVAEECTI
ncbi:hypothetical protein RND81_01G021300 [Saponaria officinalis]|uniref:Peptidase A1 domain-containing protein n=1 Tax=Saponaria officinalis TaxID=3572 RepID=A0AAW1N8H4_SAPOF